MIWLQYFDMSLCAALVCVGLGVVAFFVLPRQRRRDLESLPRYCAYLVLAVFVTSFLAYAAGFFGPLLLLSGDPLPFLGIFVTGSLGAVVGLITFLVFAFVLALRTTLAQTKLTKAPNHSLNRTARRRRWRAVRSRPVSLVR